MTKSITIESICYVPISPDENPAPGTKLFISDSGQLTVNGTGKHCAVTIEKPEYRDKVWMVKARTLAPSKEKIRFIVKYQVYYYNTGAGIPYGYFWEKKKFKTDAKAVEFCKKIKLATDENSEFFKWGCELLDFSDAYLTGECKIKKRVKTV